MFSKAFLAKLGKETLAVFVFAFGAAVLTVPGIGMAAITAGAVAGLRAALGVIVKNVGDEPDSPHM